MIPRCRNRSGARASGSSGLSRLAAVLYTFVRAVIGFALRLFYRIRFSGPLAPERGPVILVGNHPNALMDPALIFALTDRRVTFLAKSTIFAMPVLGWLVRNLGALPVYRRQDAPGEMGRNEGMFDAASGALEKGGAIMLFPEGMSHDLPHLAELKTGAARIALRAFKRGAKVRIIPVGLNYAQKHLFDSEVRIETGEPIEVEAFAEYRDEEGAESVRMLTEAIAKGLASVTLNLEKWEDLPLIKTAEALYALHHEEPKEDVARQRRFARGLPLFRAEQPERYAHLQDQLLSFRRRLDVARVDERDLQIDYRVGGVVKFVLKNLLVLAVGLPLAFLGVVLFWLPYQVPRWAASLTQSLDMKATVKFLTALVVGLLWWALLTAAATWRFGIIGGLVALLGSLPLGFFTLYIGLRIDSVLSDVGVFFTLGNRERLKAGLRDQARRLAGHIADIAEEFRARVEDGEGPSRRVL